MMMLIMVSTLCSNSVSFVIFQDDFSVPGQHSWETGQYWDYLDPDYMQEYFYKSSASGGLLWESDSLLSPEILIPLDADSLSLSVTTSYFALIDVIGVGSLYTKAQIFVERNGEAEQVWQFFQESSTSVYANWTDQLELAIPESIWSPGDTLRIRFVGECYCLIAYYDGIIELDWKLDDVALTGYSAISLQSDTWAAIKNTF